MASILPNQTTEDAHHVGEKRSVLHRRWSEGLLAGHSERRPSPSRHRSLCTLRRGRTHSRPNPRISWLRNRESSVPMNSAALLVSPKTMSLPKAILWGGLIAGVLDAIDGVVAF